MNCLGLFILVIAMLLVVSWFVILYHEYRAKKLLEIKNILDANHDIEKEILDDLDKYHSDRIEKTNL